jgi:predicted Zn-dependent protease
VDGTIPVIFALGDVNGLVPASVLPQLREFELRADWWAVSVMANAGWDPAALVRYIGRMQPAEDPRQKFSPLPERDVRLVNLIDAIRDVPGGRYSVSDEFPRIQEEIRAAMPVTLPREIPSLRKPQ